MAEMAEEQLDKAYERFCKGMGFNEDKWGSMFEFTTWVGFGIADITIDSIREGGPLTLPDRTAQLVAQLLGPHCETILRVYQCRRYSFYGRVCTPVVKMGHRIKFIYCAVVVVVSQAWSSI